MWTVGMEGGGGLFWDMEIGLDAVMEEPGELWVWLSLLYWLVPLL